MSPNTLYKGSIWEIGKGVLPYSMLQKLTLGSLAFILFSCGPSRWIEPLPVGEKEAQVSLGGPVFTNLGAPIPVPLLSMGMAKGNTENLTSYGAFHLTSLIYGNIHMEGGALYGMRDYQKDSPLAPGLSLGVSVHFATNIDESARLWPQVDFNSYWKFGEKSHLTYFGITNWLEIHNRTNEETVERPPWLISPQAGFRFKMKNGASLGIESKFITPRISNAESAVDYFSFSPDFGAMGIFLSFNQRIQ